MEFIFFEKPFMQSPFSIQAERAGPDNGLPAAKWTDFTVVD